jgi:alkanesulfonate monooxygenase SsuD/methylene tetrahydromethanopterin reductase-like flavin-dependent oxidoreductase (luciferase family)
VQVLRGLFEQERTTFEGKFYQLDNAPLAPKPVQRPWPRLLIGGGGEQVTMRIAAQYADEWNVWGSPETRRHKIGVLRAHCERLGRDASEIRKSANAMVVITDDASEAASVRERNPRALAGSAAELQGMMQEYIDAGVDELVVPMFTLRGAAGSLEATKAHADRVMAEVASAFR